MSDYIIVGHCFDGVLAISAVGDEDHFVAGLASGKPNSVLLDKRGFVRQILFGWSPINEARIINTIEQLLKAR